MGVDPSRVDLDSGSGQKIGVKQAETPELSFLKMGFARLIPC